MSLDKKWPKAYKGQSYSPTLRQDSDSACLKTPILCSTTILMNWIFVVIFPYWQIYTDILLLARYTRDYIESWEPTHEENVSGRYVAKIILFLECNYVQSSLRNSSHSVFSKNNPKMSNLDIHQRFPCMCKYFCQMTKLDFNIISKPKVNGDLPIWPVF